MFVNSENVQNIKLIAYTCILLKNEKKKQSEDARIKILFEKNKYFPGIRMCIKHSIDGFKIQNCQKKKIDKEFIFSGSIYKM